MDGPTIQESEYLMCAQILAFAETFYKDPKNVQAYEAWRKNKEEKYNGTNQNRNHV